jgi:hypothetical protein
VASKTYYQSSAGDDSVAFATRLAALMTTASPNARTYTATIVLDGAETNPTITIAKSAGTFTFTAMTTGFAAALGRSGDMTPTAASFVNTTLAPDGVWMPDCAADILYGLTAGGNTGLRQLAGEVSVGEDGTFAHFAGSTHRKNQITYHGVSKRFTLGESSATYVGEDYHTFWADSIAREANWATGVSNWRFYPDAEVDGTYVTYNLSDIRAPIISRVDSNWDGLWVVELPVIVAV